ncbi:hypothetical protein SLA_6912 [Streptomyces laurentii]|uniref:Uncharacterized protein n=1 Tax=Streptomyces laurentii TaxID=39478 RepID=A0A169PGX1_STRLU|nr:hypothetical protein SLA_6912 [Streptomyces laurentii]
MQDLVVEVGEEASVATPMRVDLGIEQHHRLGRPAARHTIANHVPEELPDRRAGRGRVVPGLLGFSAPIHGQRSLERASLTPAGTSERLVLRLGPAWCPLSGRWPSRPPGFDAEKYKERNAVERCVARLDQWRGLALRTDELSITYQAALHVASIVIRVRC